MLADPRTKQKCQSLFRVERPAGQADRMAIVYPSRMQQRTLFLFGTIALMTMASAGAACGGKNNAGFDEPDEDSGTRADATQSHDGAGTDPLDARPPSTDGASDAGTSPDGDPGTPDTGPVTGGHCSAIQGTACDLVL